MLFNSNIFIFAFLPVTLILFFVIARFSKMDYAKLWVVFASFWFYAYFEWTYAPLLLISLVVNYASSHAMTFFLRHEDFSSKFWARFALTIGILFNVIFLGYFKYYNFFVDIADLLLGVHFPVLHVLLPLGISFFTFQQIAYLVDTYRAPKTHLSVVDYAFYVTFFPQLIAGPIVLPSEIFPQLRSRFFATINYENLTQGLFIFSVGFVKKVFLADTIALAANAGYSVSSLNFGEAWITVLAYALQLYFDFSGYCDMAMGIGKMFNVTLPLNFNSPYKATDFQDFWRRWHMTLGRFMMNYLYIPLGGNRKGAVRTYVNLVTVFILSGLWHGAGFTFLIWGAGHGIAILVHRAWHNAGYKLPKLVAIPITFLLVMLLLVFFRSTSVEQSINVLYALVDIQNMGWLEGDFRQYARDITFHSDLVVGFVFAGLFIVFFMPNCYEFLKRFKFSKIHIVITIFFLLLGFLFITRITPFLYFNF